MTSTPGSEIFCGSSVMVRDYRGTNKWVPGTIVRKLGPVTYQVNIGSGNIVKRHIDQLTQRLEAQPLVPETTENPTVEDNFQYPAIVEQPRQEPVVEVCQRYLSRPSRLSRITTCHTTARGSQPEGHFRLFLKLSMRSRYNDIHTQYGAYIYGMQIHHNSSQLKT